MPNRTLPAGALGRIVEAALAEDRASEDITTLALIQNDLRGEALVVAREPGVLCGLTVATEVFHQLDQAVTLAEGVEEGCAFEPGQAVARFEGPVKALLAGERVALNFLQRLSGVATATRECVERVAGTEAVILDTRKTTPGLRDLEKYAVRCGGGVNHRRDLASMAMIKDNHLEALARDGRTMAEAVAAIRRRTPGAHVEVEVERLEQLEGAIAAGAEWVLLDNMSLDDMREAVRLTAGRAKLETSGGITLARIRDIALTGVDAMSVGALTHSVRAIDLSMELRF